MRKMFVMAAALSVVVVASAQAQSNYNTTNPVEYSNLMNGRTYDSMHSSLESQGGVGQYGTYLTIPANAKLANGYSGNGSQQVEHTYRLDRFGTDAPGFGHGSYSTSAPTGGMLSAASFSGSGRTGGSFGR